MMYLQYIVVKSISKTKNLPEAESQAELYKQQQETFCSRLVCHCRTNKIGRVIYVNNTLRQYMEDVW